MMLKAVFEYIKRNPDCSIHDIAKKFDDTELHILEAVLELQSRGYIGQISVPLSTENSESCYYHAIKQDYQDQSEFCHCKHNFPVTTDMDCSDHGYWMTCCGCGKHKEGSFQYYNHYDGEDHDETDY